MGNFSRPRALTVFSSYSLCLPAISQFCMHGLCHQHLWTVSKPLGIPCPASSIREMSISIQREEARMCEGYGLRTLSEHDAPGQESCMVTVEKPGGRARTDSLPHFPRAMPMLPSNPQGFTFTTVPSLSTTAFNARNNK